MISRKRAGIAFFPSIFIENPGGFFVGRSFKRYIDVAGRTKSDDMSRL